MYWWRTSYNVLFADILLEGKPCVLCRSYCMLLGNIGELFIGYMSLDTVYWRSFVLENILLSLSYWVYWWEMLWYWRRFHIGDQCVCNHFSLNGLCLLC